MNTKYHGDQRVFLRAVVPVLLLTFLLQEGPEATVPRPSTDICVGSGTPAWSTDLLAWGSEEEGGGSCIPAPATPREEVAVATVISVRTP